MGVRKLSPACGAEILGVDLRKSLDPDEIDEIRKAWHENLVIVIRDQELSDLDQIRFIECLGTVGEYMRPNKLRERDYHPSVMMVSNIRKNGKPIGAIPDGEMMFHHDTTYDADPHDATSLFGIQVTRDGGHTLFSNQYMVYEALPGYVKSRLADRLAMHVFEFGTTIKTKKRYDRKNAAFHPHPVFKRHPTTGKMAVYINPLLTEEILEFAEDEGEELIQTIFDYQKRPEFICEHVWRQGDLVLWDNRCLVHARTDFPTDQARQLRRVTMSKEYTVHASHQTRVPGCFRNANNRIFLNCPPNPGKTRSETWAMPCTTDS